MRNRFTDEFSSVKRSFCIRFQARALPSSPSDSASCSGLVVVEEVIARMAGHKASVSGYSSSSSLPPLSSGAAAAAAALEK